jgi:hypothetical protein
MFSEVRFFGPPAGIPDRAGTFLRYGLALMRAASSPSKIRNADRIRALGLFLELRLLARADGMSAARSPRDFGTSCWQLGDEIYVGTLA